jgi:U3 small nucleolar RNA-associated protein 21
VLVTASEDDNSIKMWLFEKGQALPRLLKERCGHAEAPHKIRFYGGLDDPTMQGARNILTCSKDGHLRDISLLNEFMSMNFSKKKQLKSIEDGLGSGPVKSLDFSQFRERDWANVLTCHSSDVNTTDVAHLWSYQNHSISKSVAQNSVKVPVTSVAVSLCGNFGVLGFLNGLISKFNM